MQEGHGELRYKRMGMLVVSFKDKGPGTVKSTFWDIESKTK